MNEYQTWSEGLTEETVRITETEQLDNTTELRLTSLLYGDNDNVVVTVMRKNERCLVSDAGEAAWAARVRHLGDERFTEDEHTKAQAIAARRNVEFEGDDVSTECDEAELEQAVKRVALACQEIEAAAARWR